MNPQPNADGRELEEGEVVGGRFLVSPMRSGMTCGTGQGDGCDVPEIVGRGFCPATSPRHRCTGPNAKLCVKRCQVTILAHR
jgi:hypothetical protein